MSKKLTLLSFLAFGLIYSIKAQNGISNFPKPTGFADSQVRFKNALAIDNSGNQWVGFPRFVCTHFFYFFIFVNRLALPC